MDKEIRDIVLKFIKGKNVHITVEHGLLGSRRINITNDYKEFTVCGNEVVFKDGLGETDIRIKLDIDTILGEEVYDYYVKNLDMFERRAKERFIDKFKEVDFEEFIKQWNENGASHGVTLETYPPATKVMY